MPRSSHELAPHRLNPNRFSSTTFQAVLVSLNTHLSSWITDDSVLCCCYIKLHCVFCSIPFAPTIYPKTVSLLAPLWSRNYPVSQPVYNLLLPPFPSPRFTTFRSGLLNSRPRGLQIASMYHLPHNLRYACPLWFALLVARLAGECDLYATAQV